MSAQTPLAVARAAWGADLPDWVARLAQECTASSQARVAAQLRRSAAMISAVIRAKYQGDMTAIEEVVRGVYMNSTLDCPANGSISTAECRDWMLKSRSYSNGNSELVRMYIACRACPRTKKEAEG